MKIVTQTIDPNGVLGANGNQLLGIPGSQPIAGASATVTFEYTEGGYDVSLDTGQALESPVVLPTVTVTVDVKQVDGRWLVDRYESRS